jgi:hypothetical protein
LQPRTLAGIFSGMPSIVDPRRFCDEFAAAMPGFRVEQLADTPAGPLVAWDRPGSGPRVYLSAGIHGDEPAGPLALLELARLGAFSEGCDWTICPALNPTGLAAGTRDNAAGIDLNRDYRKRSSSEVRAHAAWLAGRPPPELFISLHEDWETSGFYFYEINLGSDRPALARAIIMAAARWLGPEPRSSIDDHPVREPGWIYHAAEADLPDHWPEAIFLAKHGCRRSYTLETPSRAALEVRVATHVAAVRTIFASGEWREQPAWQI